MRKLKTDTELFFPHIAILLLLIAGIVISFVSLSKIGKRIEALYNESYVVKNAAYAVDNALESMQKSVFRSISNDSWDITSQEIENAKYCAAVIQEQTSVIRQNFLGNREVVSRLEDNLSELEPEQEHVLNLVSQKQNAKAAEYMENHNVPVIKEAQNNLELLIRTADAKGKEDITSLQKTRRNAIILLVWLSIISVLFSIGTAIYIWQLKSKEKINR